MYWVDGVQPKDVIVQDVVFVIIQQVFASVSLVTLEQDANIKLYSIKKNHIAFYYLVS